MNLQKIDRVIEFLEDETQDENIDMRVWVEPPTSAEPECQTTACFAGALVLLEGNIRLDDTRRVSNLASIWPEDDDPVWAAMDAKYGTPELPLGLARKSDEACQVGIRFVVAAKAILETPADWMFDISDWPEPYQDCAADRGDRSGLLKLLRDLKDGTLKLDREDFPVPPEGGWPEYHPDTF